MRGCAQAILVELQRPTRMAHRSNHHKAVVFNPGMHMDPSITKLELLSRLSAKQLAVLEAVAKRTTLKQVAQQFGVSESAINKHIRSLKLQLNANSLSDLAKVYTDISKAKPVSGCRKPACRKNHLLGHVESIEASTPGSIDPVLTFHEALTYRQSAPWEALEGVNVVPGVLNGANGKWNRGMAIILLTIGLFVAILVGLGAANGLSSAISDWRSGPDQKL